ncbi:unnamed protein product [Paramecium sonneborni]|uniref:Uncharacterized protein n=1 Tax=Paramecium sonneborni TaxID=65129 RepID=A0A8S1PAZ6_9CILI|nr:unnamed protein product [Paramecium sonneborni]
MINKQEVKSWQYNKKTEKELLDIIIKLHQDIKRGYYLLEFILYFYKEGITFNYRSQIRGQMLLNLYFKQYLFNKIYISLIELKLTKYYLNQQFFFFELRNQVKKIIGNLGVTSNYLNQLVFIEDFLTEFMRLQQTVIYSIAFKVKSKIQKKDIQVQKGTLLLLENFLVNIRSLLNNDSAYKFKPKRQLNKNQLIKIMDSQIFLLFWMKQLYFITYGNY